MGRKIPGKKHRGVKDPYKQHAQRLAAIKSKTNKTPIRPDEQPIPRSLKQLMSWKDEKKQNKVKNDIKKNKTIVKPQIKSKFLKKETANPVKKLQKLDGESKKSFNMRINDALKTLKKETTFQDIMNDLPKEPERKMTEEEEKKFKRFKKKNKAKVNEPRLTKSQKKTLREKEIKDHKKQEKELDKMYVVKTDVVKFGEIVHEPPTLNIKPRKAVTTEGAPRPARKDLLLNKLFEKQEDTVTRPKSIQTNVNMKTASKGLDLKSKRKDLPESVRRKLEETQKEAIEAYRQLKLSNKLNNKNN